MPLRNGLKRYRLFEKWKSFCISIAPGLGKGSHYESVIFFLMHVIFLHFCTAIPNVYCETLLDVLLSYQCPTIAYGMLR